MRESEEDAEEIVFLKGRAVLIEVLRKPRPHYRSSEERQQQKKRVQPIALRAALLLNRFRTKRGGRHNPQLLKCLQCFARLETDFLYGRNAPLWPRPRIATTD